MPKILIVDDSETTRLQLFHDLKNEHYDVIEAENGLEGIDKIKNEIGINLIICDVNMPKMDGLTMLSKVKDTIKDQIPVFMLTTESTIEMKQKGKENGVLAWIIKPYKKEMLLGAIKKVLS